MSDLYNKAQEAVDFIKSKIGDFQPLTAIVLGSGLGGAAEDNKAEPEREIIIEAKDIPWPRHSYTARPRALLRGLFNAGSDVPNTRNMYAGH